LRQSLRRRVGALIHKIGGGDGRFGCSGMQCRRRGLPPGEGGRNEQYPKRRAQDLFRKCQSFNADP
jgi:hypothetical protein